jgi:hypothetical protein
MDELSYSWKTENFTVVQEASFLESGSFIWVFNWDKIPHLGLSFDGAYYSATVHGSQIGESVRKFYRTIQTKEIPTFFIRIGIETFSSDLNSCFQLGLQNNETCIHPIKQVLGREYNDAQTLSDLIFCLEQNDQVEAYLSNKNVNCLFLLNYMKSDVLEMIKNIKNHVSRK